MLVGDVLLFWFLVSGLAGCQAVLCVDLALSRVSVMKWYLAAPLLVLTRALFPPPFSFVDARFFLIRLVDSDAPRAAV
jgi:ABC-type amino acid transport substrate-binding protein